MKLNFHIIKVISSGCFGKVYLAEEHDEHGNLARYVALKQCRLWSESKFPYDLLRETTVAEAFHHFNLTNVNKITNILPADKILIAEHAFFIIMEHLPGNFKLVLEILEKFAKEATEAKERNLKDCGEENSDVDDSISSRSYPKSSEKSESDDCPLLEEEKADNADFLAGSELVFEVQNSESTDKSKSHLVQYVKLSSVAKPSEEKQNECEELYTIVNDCAKSRIEEILRCTYKAHQVSKFGAFFLEMSKQLLKAFSNLHHFGFAQDDSRPSNVGVRIKNDNTIELALIDFSHSKRLSDVYDTQDLVPYPYTTGPEMYFKHPIVPESLETWACGAILANLCVPQSQFFRDDFSFDTNSSQSAGSTETLNISKVGGKDDMDCTGDSLDSIVSCTVANDGTRDGLANQTEEEEPGLDTDKNDDIKSVDNDNSEFSVQEADNSGEEEDGNEDDGNEDDENEDDTEDMEGWCGLDENDNMWFREVMIERGLLAEINEFGGFAEDIELDDIGEQCEEGEEENSKQEKEVADDEDVPDREEEDPERLYYDTYISLSNRDLFVKHIRTRRSWSKNLPAYILKWFLQCFIFNASDRPSPDELLLQLENLTSKSEKPKIDAKKNAKRKKKQGKNGKKNKEMKKSEEEERLETNEKEEKDSEYRADEHPIHAPCSWKNTQYIEMKTIFDNPFYQCESAKDSFLEAWSVLAKNKKVPLGWRTRTLVHSLELFAKLTVSDSSAGEDVQCSKQNAILSILLTQRCQQTGNPWCEALFDKKHAKEQKEGLMSAFGKLNNNIDPVQSWKHVMLSQVYTAYSKLKSNTENQNLQSVVNENLVNIAGPYGTQVSVFEIAQSLSLFTLYEQIVNPTIQTIDFVDIAEEMVAAAVRLCSKTYEIVEPELKPSDHKLFECAEYPFEEEVIKMYRSSLTRAV